VPLNFCPNGMSQGMDSWEEEDDLFPISSEEAEALRRKQALVRRMVSEEEVLEIDYDDVFNFH